MKIKTTGKIYNSSFVLHFYECTSIFLVTFGQDQLNINFKFLKLKYENCIKLISGNHFLQKHKTSFVTSECCIA